MTSFFNSSRGALIVLAALSLPISSVSAAPVPDPVAGDLFLGFRAGSEGEGGGTSYIVKLGPSATFRNAAAGSSFVVSGLGNIVTDLELTYGTTWKTRGDVTWGIFGVVNSVSSTVYGSRERSPVNTDTVPWAALDADGRNTTASAIVSVLEGTGGYKGRQATANSAVGTTQPNTTEASSYAKQVGTNGTNDFGSFSEWSSIEGDFGGGTAGTALDVYRIATAGVTRIGKFTISDAGVVTFTDASAPPSNVDTDGDGQLDSQEAVAGTSPTNPSDFFRVQPPVKSAGSVAVTFNTVAGRSYQVLYSEDLSGVWTEINVTPGGVSPYTFTDNDAVRAARAKGFYKVIATQP